jgi:hypothetical protein
MPSERRGATFLKFGLLLAVPSPEMSGSQNQYRDWDRNRDVGPKPGPDRNRDAIRIVESTTVANRSTTLNGDAEPT